jgi:hypothetical protein
MEKLNYEIIRIISFCIFVCLNDLCIVAQTQSSTINLNVQELSLTKWGSQEGITYKQVAGANLGATSFEILDNNRVAFLCDAASEIIITDRESGKSTNRFPVIYSPRDFVYDAGFFFVLNEGQVIVYDINGKEVNLLTFPNEYFGTERLTRFDNATYLLLPSGNSLKIESGGNAITPQEYEGQITSMGTFIKTQLNGNNSYSVKVIRANGNSFSKVFVVDNKVAGVFVVGSTNNRVVLDVQTFISENPIAVERTLTSIDLQDDELGAIIANIKVPDSYYVLSNKDCYVSLNGDIINMVTSPEGTYIFSLTETNSIGKKTYPESLNNRKYHFNDHLLEIEKK